MKPTIILPLAVLLLVELPFAADAEVVELRPALVEKDGVVGIEYRSGGTLVGRSTEAAPAGVELLLPGGKAAPVQFRTKTEHERIIELGPVKSWHADAALAHRSEGACTRRTHPGSDRRCRAAVRGDLSARSCPGRPVRFVFRPWLRLEAMGQRPATRAHSVLVELRLLVAAQGNPSPSGPDRPGPRGAAIDARLGVVREHGVLRLEPGRATASALPDATHSPIPR